MRSGTAGQGCWLCQGCFCGTGMLLWHRDVGSARDSSTLRLCGRAHTSAPCPLPWPGTNEPSFVTSQQKDHGRLLSGYIRGYRLLLRGFLGTRAAELHEFLLGCWGFTKIYLGCLKFASVASGTWLKKKKNQSAVQPNIKYPQRKKK